MVCALPVAVPDVLLDAFANLDRKHQIDTNSTDDLRSVVSTI